MASEDLVGMNSRVEKVIELLGLGLDDARVIGIWGMGGIGKTTIARAVYESISCQFEGCSFIENCREVSEKRGVTALQEQLIFDILMEKDVMRAAPSIGSSEIGMTMIRNRVRHKKVLVVLDDVDESTKLEEMFGRDHWFSFGSRIIITTRDRHMLTTYGVGESHVYQVEELGKEEALKFFKSRAFGKHQQQMGGGGGGYGELLDHAVEYAKGVPLALKVLGSFLFGRSKDEWESALNKLKECPQKEVQQVLRISYDALDWKEKEIFLDIACFFKGKDINDATKILDSCGFDPKIGISVLAEKSLVTVSDNNLQMHDLIQQLGWSIVREESPKEPGERSRLWLHEDIKHVLMDNMGTNKVEGIVVKYSSGLEGEDPKGRWRKQIKFSTKAFAKMTNLRILSICCRCLSGDLEYLSNKIRYLDWCGYPLQNMPATFQPDHLVELHMSYSSIVQLWKGTMLLDKLRVMNLSHSTCLTRSPDFTGFPNLERLILEGCTGLVDLHPSVKILKRLVCMNLKGCSNLKSLPSGIHLESLEILVLSGCSKLKNILESFGPMRCLSELYLDGTGIRELPLSFGDLTTLRLVNLSDCKHLTSIPYTICHLEALRTLILSGCSKLDKLPQEVGALECLKELRADWTAITQPPSSIVLLRNLETLSFRGCKGRTPTSNSSWCSFFSSLFLRRQRGNSLTLELPALSGFESLTKLNLSDCDLKSIPTAICCFSSLQKLDLSRNDFESLPASMNRLCKLYDIRLWGCKKLQELPELSSDISYVMAFDCESLRTISNPLIYKKIRGFWFTNCSKLVGNKQSNIVTDKFLLNQFQVTSVRQIEPFDIVFPGGEIPKWFSHQSMGSSVSFQLPPNWYNSSFLGFIFCAIVGINNTFLNIGIQMSIGKSLVRRHPFISCSMKSENVWVMYFPSLYLELENQFELDQLNEGGLEFKACFVEVEKKLDSWNCGYQEIEFPLEQNEVKMCGARLVYKDNDGGKDQASRSTSIPIQEVEDASSNSSTSSSSSGSNNGTSSSTSKIRRRDDLNDYYENDNHNSKRLRQSDNEPMHLDLTNDAPPS